MLDIAQPLGRSLLERHPCPHQPDQRSAPRLGDHLAQPSLGSALRIRASRRAPAAGPRRPDPFLHLAPVRKPVFGVPLRAALALDPEHVTARIRGHADDHNACLGHIWDISAAAGHVRKRRNSAFAGLLRSRRPDSNRGPLHYE
jgi:hypothetical protein